MYKKDYEISTAIRNRLFMFGHIVESVEVLQSDEGVDFTIKFSEIGADRNIIIDLENASALVEEELHIFFNRKMIEL